jgi:hypothetical protein
MRNDTASVPQPRARDLPDAKWMRKEIAIADVAHKLGLAGDSKNFDCWRDHPSGKPRRSLSVHRKSNTARCFTCDKRNLSTIDLVAGVTGYDVSAAIRWLDNEFPGAPRVSPKRDEPYVRPAKTQMTLQGLITSPGWTERSLAAKAVLAAIFARVPAAGSEKDTLRCTYDQMASWTGMSRATIARALGELRGSQAIRTWKIPTEWRTSRGFRLRETVIRVSPLALRAARVTTTGYSVQKRDSQYAVSNLNSTREVEIEV